jgi:Ca2+-transporting ATPase
MVSISSDATVNTTTAATLNIPWHSFSVENTLAQLKSSLNGLSSAEANIRIQQYGENKLIERKRRSDIELFLEQFKSFLIILLLIALVISAAFGEIIDAIAIGSIILLNALLSFYQVKKAEAALKMLKSMAVPTVKVLRDGAIITISSHSLVPGDIIYINVGDKIPADCRIVSQKNLKVDESLLTGESIPVVKDERSLKASTPLPERKNMLYMGSSVVYGHCVAVVVRTGMMTEFGKIAESVQLPEEETPLHRKLNEFGKFLGMIFVAICAMVFVIGLLRGFEIIDMIITSLALAVAAVPEGLLAAVTVALAVGVNRLAKKNAIIKRLSAVESLGSVTIICSDKTGTLTMNEMTVKRIWTLTKEVEVTGRGFNREGKFIHDGEEVDITKERDLSSAVIGGMLCNDAIVGKEIIGDPTDVALAIVGVKGGFSEYKNVGERIDEIPFDSTRKMMSVLYRLDGGEVVFTKGAVEEVLRSCTSILVNGKKMKLTTKHRRTILAVNKKYAMEAYRVIAVAMKKPKARERISESDLTFIGLHAMHDPPRPEVKEAIKTCKEAGIKVVMITGDHKDTALAIAKELDISHESALTGTELDSLSDEEFERIVENVTVYARVSPEHKVRITTALRKRGHIVAMTGDGVNDAPALRKSDVGVAMGVTGTDVTKEVGDVIVTDDNFATIVEAVKEGRGIYENIRKTVAFLLSGNIAEILIVFLAMVAGLPLPIIAIQILWINLVTDGIPVLALAVDPIATDVMKRKPKPPSEKLTSGMRAYLFDCPLIITAISLIMFAIYLGVNNNLIKAQTIVFTTIVFLELFIALSCRSIERPLGKAVFDNKYLVLTVLLSMMIHIAILNTPVLNQIFNTVPLSLEELVMITLVASIGFIYLEIVKSVNVSHQKNKNQLKYY